MQVIHSWAGNNVAQRWSHSIRAIAKICKENEVSIFIDNTYEHYESALSLGIDAILFDTIYNKDIDDVKRMSSWEEIYNYIKEVSNDKNCWWKTNGFR